MKNTVLDGKSAFWVWIAPMPFLLLATALYLYGVRGNLPYHLDPDEPVYYIAASQIRQSGLNQIKPTYPPLRFYEMAVEQAVLDAVTGRPADPMVYFIVSRATSAFAALVLLAIMHRIGRQLHSPLGGFFALILLAFDSQMVEFSHLARADTWAWALGGAIILQTGRLLHKSDKHRWMTVWGLSVGAILFKYSIAPLALLPGAVLLTTHGRRKAVQWGCGLLGIVAALAGAVTIALLRAHSDNVYLRLSDINLEFLVTDQLPLWDNFAASISAIRVAAGDLWLGVTVSTLCLNLVLKQDRSVAINWSKIFGFSALVIVVTLALFMLRPFRYWDGYQIVILLAVCGGVGLGRLAQKFHYPGLAATLLIASILVFPKIIAARELGRNFTQPHSLAMLGDWFIANVPQGARVVVEQSTPFNSYAGFPGRPIYHQYTVDSLFNENTEAYRERGYEYLVWSSKGYHSPEQSDPQTLASQAYFTNAAEVARWLPPEYRLPAIVVFQLPPIQQHPLYAWFTPAISFRGYDLNKNTFAPGERIELMLYWMSAERVPNNYIVFIHLINADTGQLAVGQDGPPDYGNTPTYEWRGDMDFIRDQRVLTLPTDIAPGAYTLRIGMYDADTKARVDVLDLDDQPVGDSLLLQEIQITD